MARSQADRVVVGWKLDPTERQTLLDRFSPVYPNVIADHVTLAKAPPATSLPSETAGEIVGLVDDEAGLQALVVAIGGTTGRPDGGTYHVTWSLTPDRRPVQSNEVLARLGWTAIHEPVPLTLIPARF